MKEERLLLKLSKNRRHSWRGHTIRHNEIVINILEGAIFGKKAVGRAGLQYLKQVARNTGADSYTATKRMACNNSSWKVANQSKDRRISRRRRRRRQCKMRDDKLVHYTVFYDNFKYFVCERSVFCDDVITPYLILLAACNERALWDLSFFIHGATAPIGPGQGLPIIEVSRSHSVIHTTLGRTPLDKWYPDAAKSTWQHTTLTTGRHPCPRRCSNPQSLQASGDRPRP